MSSERVVAVHVVQSTQVIDLAGEVLWATRCSQRTLRKRPEHVLGCARQTDLKRRNIQNTVQLSILILTEYVHQNLMKMFGSIWLQTFERRFFLVVLADGDLS